ncbi:hypothetical protein Hanom_Chr04g00377901 [Helianthus anomalus]
MNQISRKKWGLNLKRTIIWRVAFLRRCVRSLWHQILTCWMGKSVRYRQLLNSGSGQLIPTSSRYLLPAERATAVDMAAVSASSSDRFASGEMTSSFGGDGCDDHDASDLVALKICLLGDQQIGKTSFLVSFSFFFFFFFFLKIILSYLTNINNKYLFLLIYWITCRVSLFPHL